MGKVVKILAGVVGVAALVIPGVGTAISAGIWGALTGGAVGALSAGVLAFSQIAVAGLASFGLSSALSVAAKAAGLGPKPPKQSPASSDRLRAQLDPRTFRKIVFGRTASAVDVRYQEFKGADQEYLYSVIVLASHALEAIDEIWFDEKRAWSQTAGIPAEFTGYLDVSVWLEGNAGGSYTIPGSTSWTSAHSRFVGCAYIIIRYKLTGNTKKAESPFATSVTSRITVRVKAAKVYDPRRDTTAGGSGLHRADNQATWRYVSDDVARNPALQLLWYLLGWRIQNPVTGVWKLAVGLGLPKSRIDIASFIAAANLCDEPVTLAAGGTEPRYRADGVFSEGDDPSLVFENLLASMNGVLRDAGGKLSLEVLHNDLALPLDLDAGDVIGEFTWLQTPPIDQAWNVVRGRFVDASDAGLYQMIDFPEVGIDSPDGIERPSPPLELSTVQSPGQAQRLAKQFLQRSLYPGTFSAVFLASAWRCRVGSVVSLTFPALGFSDKLFRVVEHTIKLDGTCPMVLREENPAIYAWDHEENPPVTAAQPIRYNPLNEPWVQALGDVEVDLVDTSDALNELDQIVRAANNRNPATPIAPTMLGSGLAIEHVANADGSCDIVFKWDFTGTEADNDWFEIEAINRTSTAPYTPGSDPAALVTAVPIHRRAFALTGVPQNRNYTFSARTRRDVDADIDPTRRKVSAWVKSTFTGENPYLPNANPVSLLDLQGTIGGLDATIVAATINPDGSIATGKVVEDSIEDGAINGAEYIRHGGLIGIGAGESPYTQPFLGAFGVRGGELNISAVIPVEVSIVNPVQGNKYEVGVYVYVERNGTGIKQYSDADYCTVTWTAPSVSGEKTVTGSPLMVQHRFTGLTNGNYYVGFYIPSMPNNGCVLRPYRKLWIDNPRAAQ